MGFFRYISNSSEATLCNEFKVILPSLHKIHQQGRYDELMAAFIVSLCGFKDIYRNYSPEGEINHAASTRKIAIQGLQGNMFDALVNWLTGAYISQLSSTEQLTIKTLASLKDNFFVPAFQKFETGSLTNNLLNDFAALTRDQRRNVLRALGTWNPLNI